MASAKGDVRARRIGEGGGSNFTFLLERGVDRFVLAATSASAASALGARRRARGRLQLALREAGFSRLPTIVAVAEDETILGVPFYVMTYLDGDVLTDELVPGLEEEPSAGGSARISSTRSSRSTKPTSRLRVSRRSPGPEATASVRSGASRQLWGINKTREIPTVERVGEWLGDNVPSQLPETVVHGDFRLGNTMVAPDDPSRIVAVLDWEMGAIGDPRADLGYLLATYSEPGGPPNPLGTSPVTALPGFPSKSELDRALRRAERPRRRVALLVRGARPLEGGRLLRGDLRQVSCAVSSGPRTSAPRGSSKAFRISPKRAAEAISCGPAAYSAISASARSASGCCVETRSDVAPDSRQASSRSASRSFGPTSATSSTNESGIAAAASRLFPPR